jgi:hypothetical protein
VLSTASITLDGARDSLVRTVEIVFPEGTSPREGEPDRVRVTVQIQPVKQIFQVQLPAQVTVSGVGAGLSVSISPQVVTLDLTGSSDALATLTQTPPRAALDVSGLDAGGYVLTATITLPPGVTLVGDPPTIQVALRPPPTAPATATSETTGGATPTPSEGAPPGPTATDEPTTTPGPTATPDPTATPGPTATP